MNRWLFAIAIATTACKHSLPPAPEEPARDVDHEIAAMVGVVSKDRIADDVTMLAGMKTRNTCSSDIELATAIVQARLATSGLAVTTDSFDAPCTPPVARSSVIGVLRGRDPTRLVMLGGHYDSRSIDRNDGSAPAPGANDSGSQTALVLDVARALAGHAFETSIAFVLFAGEEQGLLGSSSVASHLATLFPGAKLEAMINCDIVGGDADANHDDVALHRVRVYAPGAPRETKAETPDGTPDNTSPSRGLQHFIESWGDAYVRDMNIDPKLREDRPGRGSDHEPFIALGIPAVRFIEENETLAHQHTPDDVAKHVTPAYTTRVARVVTATLATLARAPRAPTNLTATRGKDRVALRWTAPADHVVITTRPAPAHSPMNHIRRFRVKGDSFELAPPEAAFFVTVSAVDAAGHESLAAWPEWRCDEKDCTVPVTLADAIIKR